MNTYDLLKKAILEKKQVLASYAGKQRFLCPHVLGTKNGVKQCFFYQFDGDSTSKPIVYGSSDNWRCMKIESFSEISLRDGAWHTQENYDLRTQTCIDEIEVVIDS